MRVALRFVPIALAALLLATACGGSDSAGTVGDCVIEPATQCPNADLTDADLSGADLSGANLSGATLEGTNLSGANLTEANLTGAQITGADLSDADLTRTNLTGATITGTDLAGATLCGTTRTDGTIDDSSCPASTDTTESDTTETDTTAASEAEVTSFDVGDLSCEAGAPSAPVTLSWETQNATAVDIALDTAAPTGYAPSGSTELQVPCDGGEHAITITPQSDAGPGVPETERVSPG